MSSKCLDELSPQLARRVIEAVGGPGTPPATGFQYFTRGIQPYIGVLDDEYLRTFLKDGGSAFKLVIGAYGGGKTHFLYCVRDLAWSNGFVVSYVSLKQGESPFHQLDLVYKAVVKGLTPPPLEDGHSGELEAGIRAFLKSWVGSTMAGSASTDVLLDRLATIEVEDLSFGNAMHAAVQALLDGRTADFDLTCQWLAGEGYIRGMHAKHGILHRLDKTVAFAMLRSLAQFVRAVGYSGLVVLLDEAERVPSLSTKQKEQHLSHLREVIDESANDRLPGVLIAYAVPDESFLDGRAQVYEALRQRVETVFEDLNPTGVRINLDTLAEDQAQDPRDVLREIGRDLAGIYRRAYDTSLDSNLVDALVSMVAEHAYELRFGDTGYKRVFVQRLVRGLHYVRLRRQLPSAEDLEPKDR